MYSLIDRVINTEKFTTKNGILLQILGILFQK